MTHLSFVKKCILRFTIFGCLCIITSHAVAQTQLDTKRVIFPQEIHILFDLKKDTSINRFTPTMADIDAVDTLLHQYMLQANPQRKRPVIYADYYRQYAGFLINGKKCIFVNASCEPKDYFLKNTYYPKGGGHCYFRAIVDLDFQQISEIHFNAPR